MTLLEEERPAPPRRRANPLLAMLRNAWRQLTSMRTALVLLFLLAIAAIPGSVFPQRTVNRENVAEYFRANPQLAPWLDRFDMFDVYSSVWFAAIYLLLFTSLIGCVVPRLIDLVRSVAKAPPRTPRRFDRLPQHAAARDHPAEPEAAARSTAAMLRKQWFRASVRAENDGWTVSAEKGHLKEAGNLFFHFALLAVLIGVGFGHWYGWHGNRILVQGADYGFCNSQTQLDESTLGPRVSAADLPIFCMELTGFDVDYEANGQPKWFDAQVSVTEGDGAASTEHFTVNDPLRLDGATVNLLGEGYAAELRFTDRYGKAQTRVVPFLPIDLMKTSEGVAQFADVNIDPATGIRDPNLQMGFEAVYVPTVDPSGNPASIWPGERDPVMFVSAYRGDLGVDNGKPNSVYTLNQDRIESGMLKNITNGRPHELRKGETWTLDDGSTLEFVATRPFVTLAVRSDPGQVPVLIGAVIGLIGLMLSLAGHRRRVWFRFTPVSAPDDAAGQNGRSLMTAGGLPRTDHPGFADEFDRLVTAATTDERAP